MPLLILMLWQVFALYASTHLSMSSVSALTTRPRASNTDQIKCSDGWLNYHNGRGRCYFLSNTSKSWPDVLSDCQQRGADLLSIHNVEENTYVSTSVTSQRVWIGLNDRYQEGLFKWTDGSSPNSTSWGNDLPDSIPPSEDCVEINFQHPGEWNDLYCNTPLHYICVKEGSAIRTVPTSTSTAISTLTPKPTLMATTTATSTWTANSDPCTSYSTLLEGPRDTHLETNKSSTFLCDDQLRPGWYRFSGGEVAISSIHKYHCGTKSTIWMNDKFPSVKDGIAEKKFCFNHLDLTPNGCLWSEQVPVKNCRGEFMVYHLPLETILCPMAICTGLYIGGECDLVLRPSSWDEGTHESRLNLSLGTQVDPAVKPDKTLSISFETMLNNVPGLEYWSGVTVPQTKVLNTDTPFSTCRGSGDPHFTASFNPAIFHELGVGYYNMYHLGDFNFASDTRAQLAVQARMSLYSAGRSMICAVAVQKGDDVIFINSCQRSVPSITANNLITDGSVQLCGSNEYQITTNQGHRISVVTGNSYYIVTATFPHGVVPLEAFDVNNKTKEELCNPSTTVNGMTTFTSGGIIAGSTVGYFRVQPDQNLFEGHRVKMVSAPVNNDIYCSCNSKQKGEQNACGRGQKVIDPYIQRGSCQLIVPTQTKPASKIAKSSNVDPIHYSPPDLHWPTPSGITEK